MHLYSYLLKRVLVPIGDIVFKSSFSASLKGLRNQATFSSDQLQEIQRSKLYKLLVHAASHSKYYSALNVERDLDPAAWLKRFPVLTKRILKDHAEKLLTEPASNLNRHNSSGSSGFQATVYLSNNEQDIDRATQVLWWEWAGYKVGDAIVQTGINPIRSQIKRVKDFFFRTKYIAAFSHTQKDFRSALTWAAKKRQPVLAGYASSLYVMAKLANDEGVSVPFKTVITWGDKLFDHYRVAIEKTFKAKVYETYGTGEGFKIAAQKDLPYMYIMTNNVFLELLDDKGNEVNDGEIGHVVVTSLNSFAMPLIRYQIGDMAIKLPIDKYPEKRELGFPLLQRVVGRDTDLIKTRSGKFMVVHSFTGIFEHIPQIIQFCIIQHNLEGIEIEFIPAEDFRVEILENIRSKIITALGEEFKITFKQVNEIKPTKSGKPQIIQSYLPKAELV